MCIIERRIVVRRNRPECKKIHVNRQHAKGRNIPVSTLPDLKPLWNLVSKSKGASIIVITTEREVGIWITRWILEWHLSEEGGGGERTQGLFFGCLIEIGYLRREKQKVPSRCFNVTIQAQTYSCFLKHAIGKLFGLRK